MSYWRWLRKNIGRLVRGFFAGLFSSATEILVGGIMFGISLVLSPVVTYGVIVGRSPLMHLLGWLAVPTGFFLFTHGLYREEKRNNEVSAR